MSAFTRIAVTVAALGMLTPVALAAELTGQANVSVGLNAGVQASRASTTVRGDAELDDDDSTTTGSEERSEVATQVQALLRAADRDGGIGVEVRAIAREFASSSERAGEAMASVEGRPGWLTFIIGTDYGSLGKLRSEVATTQSQIQRLTSAAYRATDVSVKASLQAQISALKLQASTTEAFVNDNEDSFSIFGWFFKIFS